MGFRLLGLRLTTTDIKLAMNGYNSQLNTDNENIAVAFGRALKEECLVNQVKIPYKVA